MSPIEYVWDALDGRIQQQVPVPANIQELGTPIKEERTNMPQATIDSLVKSKYQPSHYATTLQTGIADASTTSSGKFLNFFDEMDYVRS